MWDHEGCGSSMCCKARPNQQGLPLKQFELTMQRRLWRLGFEVEFLLKEQSLIVKQREIISQLHNQVRQPGWHNIDTVWAIWEYVMIVASSFPLRNIAHPKETKEIRKSFKQVAARSPWNMFPAGPARFVACRRKCKDHNGARSPRKTSRQSGNNVLSSCRCQHTAVGYPLVIHWLSIGYPLQSQEREVKSTENCGKWLFYLFWVATLLYLSDMNGMNLYIVGNTSVFFCLPRCEKVFFCLESQALVLSSSERGQSFVSKSREVGKFAEFQALVHDLFAVYVYYIYTIYIYTHTHTPFFRLYYILLYITHHAYNIYIYNRHTYDSGLPIIVYYHSAGVHELRIPMNQPLSQNPIIAMSTFNARWIPLSPPCIIIWMCWRSRKPWWWKAWKASTRPSTTSLVQWRKPLMSSTLAVELK